MNNENDGGHHSEYIPIPADVPQLEPELLWLKDWYDGPTAGAVRVNGELMIARMAAECWHREGICDWYRKYVIKKISPEDQAQEIERHEDFARWVSGDFNDTGWTFGLKGHHDRAQWQLFYDKHPSNWEPEGTIIGWFSLP